MTDDEKKSETETFSQRAAAAKSNETKERDLRVAQVVAAVLSKPSDGVNERTTATFTGAGGRSFDRHKRRRKPKTLDQQFAEIWK
jgi:hypothetical protein